MTSVALHNTLLLMAQTSKPAHPGNFIRTRVIPAGMSVTEAAKRLSVSRPALSNLLNGRAALSAEMATRLEKAFSADRQRLVELQAAYDRHEQIERDGGLAVSPFAPSFLAIKAHEIEHWANSQIEARNRLSVLLRKLINSTGRDLQKVDFPGYDNAQRPGNDGIVEAGAANQWIPQGRSYWEFGVDKNPKTKADDDYKSRLTSTTLVERANAVFVFVTPRNWKDKSSWEKKKSERGEWKAVRVYDASDLEQWLEQSIPAQMWLAEQIGKPTSGFETLDQAWRRWAMACDPHLSPEIFATAISQHKKTLQNWLNESNNPPFVVAADSKDEAIAFLAQLFQQVDFLGFKDKVAVVTSLETLRQLTTPSITFLPIVYADELERELSASRLPYIVFRPRNAVGSEANVTLDLLSYDAFRRALVSMGCDDLEISRLEEQSGRSPTILRRRLAPPTSAICKPEWAGNHEIAESLIPMALIGAWCPDSDADKDIVSLIANCDYESTESCLNRLLSLDDCPVWAAGRCRGVTSKIDCLFAVAGRVTQASLDRFFAAAEVVLSETDPALELPEQQRWAAAIYGKKRNYSRTLRRGLCETLVILSVFGNQWFQSKLGWDAESRVAMLVRKFLTPLSLEKLRSHKDELPLFAEAAPKEFLGIIEEDLGQPSPVIYGLMKPSNGGAFWGSCHRTGLLWALESLAWSPQLLPRVARVLAHLAQLKIDDNVANRPDASLQQVFCSWMPQTAATVEQRIAALKLLVKVFPSTGWEIALDQIKGGTRIGHYANRPTWRTDASGAGQVVTVEEARGFIRAALDMLLGWPDHNSQTLGDLVEHSQSLPETDQLAIWTLIQNWSEAASDAEKACMRERVRCFALTRVGQRRNLDETTRVVARQVYHKLCPKDVVVRHAWLFATEWVQESADENDANESDWRARCQRINKERCEAVAEIWAARQFQGVVELLKVCGAAAVIGQYASGCTADAEQRLDFLVNCLSLKNDIEKQAEACLWGYLWAFEEGERIELIRRAAKRLASEERARLFLASPFKDSTWRVVESFGEDELRYYWENVVPKGARHTQSELNYLIDRLLEAKRPRVAMFAVHLNFEEVEQTRLSRLLRELAMTNSDKDISYRIKSYEISDALNSLNSRPGISLDDMAELEFLFIDALDATEHGIPNLERQVAESPALFVQAISLGFKRSDECDDTPALLAEESGKRSAAASAAYTLLLRIKRIPGTDSDGRIVANDLLTWIREVRTLCREIAREDIGDHWIGQLLAKSPSDQTGTWPCEAVCQVLEELASSQIARGLEIGKFNSRGVHFRKEGGEEERTLADEFHKWAEHWRYNYPFVGNVLDGIAKSYCRDAVRENDEAEVSKRLRR